MRMRWYGIFGLLLIAAMVVWVWKRGEGKRVVVFPRPREAQGQRLEGVKLKPKETPVSATHLEELTVEVSQLVKVVIGQDDATARRYGARSKAVWKLGEELPEEAVTALLGYLRLTEDVLREERVDALKNDIINVLRTQRQVSPELSETLIAMFDSKAYGVAMLDYCIQHLGALQEASQDAEERARIYACLQRAALVPGASYAGTALIALVHTPGEDDEQRHFVNERVASLLYERDTHEAARITATQIAAECDYTELLPLIRSIVRDESLSATQRVAAIGALGLFRQREDVALLEDVLSKKENVRLRPAVEAAIKRIEK